MNNKKKDDKGLYPAGFPAFVGRCKPTDEMKEGLKPSGILEIGEEVIGGDNEGLPPRGVVNIPHAEGEFNLDGVEYVTVPKKQISDQHKVIKNLKVKLSSYAECKSCSKQLGINELRLNELLHNLSDQRKVSQALYQLLSSFPDECQERGYSEHPRHICETKCKEKELCIMWHDSETLEQFTNKILEVK